MRGVFRRSSRVVHDAPNYNLGLEDGALWGNRHGLGAASSSSLVRAFLKSQANQSLCIFSWGKHSTTRVRQPPKWIYQYGQNRSDGRP